jgi:hypothetical protein
LLLHLLYEFGGHSGPSSEETTPFLLVPSTCLEDWPELTERQYHKRLTLMALHRRLVKLYCHEAPAVPVATPLGPLHIEEVG